MLYDTVTIPVMLLKDNRQTQSRHPSRHQIKGLSRQADGQSNSEGLQTNFLDSQTFKHTMQLVRRNGPDHKHTAQIDRPTVQTIRPSILTVSYILNNQTNNLDRPSAHPEGRFRQSHRQSRYPYGLMPVDSTFARNQHFMQDDTLPHYMLIMSESLVKVSITGRLN